MTLDNHSQPLNLSYNLSRNYEKAVYALKGILLGITGDNELNTLELLFLDLWLKEQEHLKDDGDVIDLLDLIGDILKDGKITKADLNQLHELINDIIDYKKTEDAGDESLTNEFLGLLSGIASDNKINEPEIELLLGWLALNQSILDQWPFDIIVSQLKDILEDGIITDDECQNFLEVIQNITGIHFEESGMAYGMATEFFESDISELNRKATFCFTGKFVTGTRKVVQNTAIKKGGETKDDVSQSVTYLVIGTLASRDWRFTSHGRKIEKALNMQKTGHTIQIINERTWLKHI
jgi:hypothetical protein